MQTYARESVTQSGEGVLPRVHDYTTTTATAAATATTTTTTTATTHTAEASHTADHRGRFNSWCTRALDAAAVGTLPPSLTAGHARRVNRFFL